MARVPRFFVENEISKKSSVVDLSASETHHAKNVLRLPDGAAVELWNGRGQVAQGRIAVNSARVITVEIEQFESFPPIFPQLTIATAVPKGKRWRVLIEKCTELSADIIQPITYTHSVVKGEGNPVKWREWAVAAGKQCRRAWLPELAAPKSLNDFLGAGEFDCLLLAAPEIAVTGEAKIELATALRTSKRVAILIGSEAGLAAEETAASLAAGAYEICLGQYILRTETAAMVACAIVRERSGWND